CLSPQRELIGSEMRLHQALAADAFGTLAARLGMSVEEAALGALQIQKYGMAQAIELNSVRRGYDPREFTLVAAGGAGPLFACDLALELEIGRVLVPPYPGIVAATGLLATARAHEAEYGHRFDAQIEIINIRAVGIGRVDELRPAELERGDGAPSAARTLEREVVFDVGGKPETLVAPFYEREKLRAGDRIKGP